MALEERLLALAPGSKMWTARPECESRTTNIESSVSTPSNQTLTQPKSTSASSPGGCSWGIVHGHPAGRERREGGD